MIKTYLTREIVPEYIVDRAQAILGHPLPDHVIGQPEYEIDSSSPWNLIRSVRMMKTNSGYLPLDGD